MVYGMRKKKKVYSRAHWVWAGLRRQKGLRKKISNSKIEVW
jgi:hypothetical protein